MPNGKYCIKIDGKVISAENQDCAGNGAPLLFDSVEAAAKRHDQVLEESGKAHQSQMNYRPDGLRIVHEEETKAILTIDDSGVLEGGTASSLIVPALAVINIKVRTEHLDHFHCKHVGPSSHSSQHRTFQKM